MWSMWVWVKKMSALRLLPSSCMIFLAEGANAGARINYDAARTTGDLKAGCVAAIFNGIRAGTSDAASGSPELETKGSIV